jgi:hypothetical protein
MAIGLPYASYYNDWEIEAIMDRFPDFQARRVTRA